MQKSTFWKYSHLGCLINPFNCGTHILIADKTQAPKFPETHLFLQCTESGNLHILWSQLWRQGLGEADGKAAQPFGRGAGQAPSRISSLGKAQGLSRLSKALLTAFPPGAALADLPKQERETHLHSNNCLVVASCNLSILTLTLNNSLLLHTLHCREQHPEGR